MPHKIQEMVSKAFYIAPSVLQIYWFISFRGSVPNRTGYTVTQK